MPVDGVGSNGLALLGRALIAATGVKTMSIFYVIGVIVVVIVVAGFLGVHV
jgi:hypothetical protein